MADDDQNLVSEIKIQGADQSTADLKKFGDEGAAAFDKVGAAAKKSGDAVADSTSKMQKGADDATKALSGPPSKLQAIASAATALASATRSGLGGLTAFGAAITTVVGAGVAGVVGIAKFASAVTGAAREVDRAGKVAQESAAQQKKNNEQYVQSVSTAAQYQSQLNSLNRQVAAGKTSYEDYAQAVDDLNFQYREQVKVQAQVQAAQDDALRQNQQLERIAQNRANLEALNKTYGVTLTQSLIKLGDTYDRVVHQARDAFGPVLAGLIDKIVALVDKNSGAITKFIDDASKSMAEFFKENGPAIDTMIKLIVEIGAAFVKVVTSVIVPAVTTFLSALDKVAGVINTVFGTDINGAFLAVVLVIGVLSGVFSSLATVIGLVVTAVSFLATAFSPLVLVIGLLVAAFVALAASIDWTAFAKRAVAAGTAILNFFTQLPANIGAVFTAFFQFVTDGFTALVANILAIWQSVVDFFNGLIQTVQGIFTQIGTAIHNAFQQALNFVVQLFTDWADRVLSFIKPVIDALKKVKQLMSQTGTGGNSGSSGSVNAATGGHIRGPGTGTSDSIPAWLSNGEFVVKARSVAKYGLGLLHALNSGRFKMPGFAMGGLVGMPQPMRFASGGPVNNSQQGNMAGRKAFDLHIDGTTFRGLLAPDDVADKMTQFAISRGSLSGGRKPAWVGGSN